MNWLIGFALALALAISPATAADLRIEPGAYQARPVVVIFRWTGFYIGAHAGGGFGTKEESSVPFTFGGSILAPNPATIDVSGGFAGGQIGADFQVESWVFGGEIQASWARLTGNTTCTSTATNVFVVVPGSGNCSARVNALGTIAIRAGMAFDRLLVYGKGGAAWTDDSYESVATTATAAMPQLFFTANETRWGWMLGIGVEYAFLDDWSAKVEYAHLGMGTRALRFTEPNGLALLDTDIVEQINIVKVGVNYRLGVRPVAIRY